MVKCFKCEKTINLEVGSKILRSEECPHCEQSLYVCRMCKNYKENYYNECYESQAERIVDKEKANYCEYFSLENSNDSTNLDELKTKADSIFKN